MLPGKLRAKSELVPYQRSYRVDIAIKLWALLQVETLGVRRIDHVPNVPILVACALDGIRKADDGLFGWGWIFVSNDNAVQGTTAEFGVETLLSDQFATVLGSAD